jgi:uncharacterized Zn-binding protein involved in type VI secretion
MPAATRQGDTCTGHGAFPPRAATEGSPNVYINGLPANRVGDAWAAHCNSSGCHPSTTASGSSSVFINGKAAARIGDDIACGSVVAKGSSSVFIGG